MHKAKSKEPSSQATISSYFTTKSPENALTKKRPSSSIDLTADDGRAPFKKVRTTITPAEDVNTQASRIEPHTADLWRYSPSPLRQPEPLDDSTPAQVAARKARHEAFKKKLLGENNTIFRKRNGQNSDVIDVDVDTNLESSVGKQNTERHDESGDDSDTAFTQLRDMFSHSSSKRKYSVNAPSKTRLSAVHKKADEEIGPSGQTYTPLEKQVLKFKAENPGTLLMIEVGYKYRFFGEDAKVAAKELGVVCFPDRNFSVASVPTYRRDIYVKKLLAQGYRVGIVEQIETAALKKISDNRNALFERKLAHLYTATTYVDELDSVDDLERYHPPPLLCLLEEQKGGMGVDDRVSISMIAICPSTGDVVWDDFEDSHMRTELETRMVHTRPAEILLPESGLSKSTEKMLTHFTNPTSGRDKIRSEYFEGHLSYTEAFALVSEFYTDNSILVTSPDNVKSGKFIAEIVNFPKRVVIVLAHTIKHLISFSIADALRETNFFTRFTAKFQMLLNGNTLENLEIYRNETDHTTKGSLMWILDRTKTKFGARMLRSWVGKPLTDMSALQDRVGAVEEIISSSSDLLVTLRHVLKNLPDLAKGLCRIQYGKCTPQELAGILTAFNKIAIAFNSYDKPSDVGFESRVLNEIIFSLPKLKEPMKDILSIVSLKRAAEGKKDAMWIDSGKYPDIGDMDMCIQAIEVELKEELKSIRRILRLPALKYITVLGNEYLIELKKTENHAVPDNWHIASRTKNTERYYTPEVKQKVEERERYQEAVQAAANRAYLSFLGDISQKYYAVMRDIVEKLAMADCLLSLALVALQDNYVRPEFTEEDILEIVDGRHPMVEALRADPFVPNTVKMGGENARSKIITGPNMGGKSSCVRMVALIAIMAQIGSYMPATSVRLGMQDKILTRMGATDDLARGRSTFMIEMSETSDILTSVTSRSLVILDELGRGTSTFDGMAIAHAVLDHLVSTSKCKTLFITHYPLVATSLEQKHPTDVENLHMGYQEESRIDGTRDIIFLYRLTKGLALESFGVECARLAGIPENILKLAMRLSGIMQNQVLTRVRRNKAQKSLQLIARCLETSNSDVVMALHELRSMIVSLSVSDN